MTPENPVCPDGYGCAAKSETTIKEILESVLKKLDYIEMKINHITPVYPPSKDMYHMSSTKCGRCGMEWKGAMGYVCIQPGCPVQMQITSQISTFTGDFNIESADPDKRTWYYDGDETKRSKE
jgi:hypothetical protein